MFVLCFDFGFLLFWAVALGAICCFWLVCIEILHLMFVCSFGGVILGVLLVLCVLLVSGFREFWCFAVLFLV